jgi:sRNA-binding carbon storage regulator CsrA
MDQLFKKKYKKYKLKYLKKKGGGSQDNITRYVFTITSLDGTSISVTVNAPNIIKIVLLELIRQLKSSTPESYKGIQLIFQKDSNKFIINEFGTIFDLQTKTIITDNIFEQTPEPDGTINISLNLCYSIFKIQLYSALSTDIQNDEYILHTSANLNEIFDIFKVTVKSTQEALVYKCYTYTDKIKPMQSHITESQSGESDFIIAIDHNLSGDANIKIYHNSQKDTINVPITGLLLDYLFSNHKELLKQIVDDEFFNKIYALGSHVGSLFNL